MLLQFFRKLPFFCDLWWLRSDAKSRLIITKGLNGEEALFNKDLSIVYALYCANQYSDIQGLELMHQHLMLSHKERLEDRQRFCQYPMLMLCLFVFLRSWVYMGAGLLFWLPILFFLVLCSQAVVLEFLNRNILRALLFPSQPLFESWAILMAWQSRNHPWNAACYGDSLLSLTLLTELQKLRFNEAEFVNASEQMLIFQKQYRQQMRVIWLVLGTLFYGILIYLSLEWMLWIMRPIQLLEQSW